MRITLALLATAVSALVPAAAGAVPSIPATLEARTVASGLQAPTAVAFAADGRVFIAEKQGTVKVVLPGEAPRARLLADISSHVATHVDRGLLGIATDADFAHNGYLYLLYTYDPNPARTADPKVNRLTRITVGAGASVTSGERVVLGSSSLRTCPKPGASVDCIPSDGFSHSIGAVRAGSDGTLWIGVGDGVTPGSTSSTIMRALDPNVMSGAILHVDRSGRGLANHRFCRTVTDLKRSCTKVWSKGFRNPFRFSLLPDGRVAVGDVGFEAWEELDIAEAGKSYGWPCREGNHPTPGYSTTSACRRVPLSSQAGPVFEYAHGARGGSIMAGPQLGDSWPAGMSGRLVLGDYAVGTLSLLDLSNTGLGATALLDDLDAVVDVTPSPSGAVALVEAGFTASGLEPGRVWLLAPAGAGQRPWPRPGVSVDGLSASFDPHVRDADSDPTALTYLWDFGDGTTSTEARPTHSYGAPGSYSVRVTVSDGSESGSDVIPVNVGLDLPLVTITQPASGTKVVGGSTVSLAGSATVDGEPVRPSLLSWVVLLHHGAHEHYLTGFNGTVGSFVAPRDHDSDSWYEARLTATTLEGRTASATVRLDPKLRTLTLATSPGGIPVGWAGHSVTAPRSTAVGFRSALSVAKTTKVGGRTYRFVKWSDGSRSSSRQFTMPDADTRLTATYARG